MKLEWNKGGLGQWLYADTESGRIYGEADNGGAGIVVYVNGAPQGRYLKLEQAMKAVETGVAKFLGRRT